MDMAALPLRHRASQRRHASPDVDGMVIHANGIDRQPDTGFLQAKSAFRRMAIRKYDSF